MEVIFSPLDEIWKFLELLHSYGSLHIGHLEVIADMGIHVLVIVSFGESPVLGRKTFPAGIVLSSGTVAISAPVPDRSRRAGERLVVRKDATALSHRDVVRRIEGTGRNVTETAHQLAFIRRTERIAAILDEPKMVFFD